MEDKFLPWNKLFSTALLQVLDFLLQHPEQELNDSEIARKLKKEASLAAVNNALHLLAALNLTQRSRRGKMALNRLNDNPLIHHLKIVSNLMLIQPLVEELKCTCLQIILFGSRARGEQSTESDFDLFVVADDHDAIRRIVKHSPLEEKLSLLIKSTEEWLSLSTDDRVLYDTVKEGIILWEQR